VSFTQGLRKFEGVVVIDFELSRNITVGQYLPTGSLVHRLDPRAKIIATICLILLFSSTQSIVATALSIGFLLLIARLAHIPILYILRGLLPMMGLLIVLFVVQLIFQGWAEPSGKVYFEWGFIRVTRLSVHSIILAALRVVAFLFVISLLTLTTTSTHLMHGIEILLRPLQRLGVPVHELAMINMIALRFVPTLAEELETIMKAQASRGANVGAQPVWRPDLAARARLPLLVPLFLGALRRAEDLVLAMDARGYVGGARRTSYFQLHANWLDGAVAVGAILIYLFVVLAPWPPVRTYLPFL
jgi:energy-coupling factor transport system permease protein